MRFKRLATTVFIGLGTGLILAVVLVRVLENRFIYFPPRYPDGFVSPQNYGLSAEEVWFTAEDGVKLNAWFFPNLASPKALLVFHGNAENIGYGLPRLKVFSRLGTNLLAVDYRGYGKSEGSPNETGLYRDAEAAYRYLVERRHIEPGNIFVYGQSLGSAVAIDLASRHECGGLIAESPFTSVLEVARRSFRIPFFEYVPKSRFDSLSKISRVRAPILVVHGARDQVFPYSMGESLYRAAPEPKSFLLVQSAGHDDIFLVAEERYLGAIRKLMGVTTPVPAAAVAPSEGHKHEVR